MTNPEEYGLTQEDVQNVKDIPPTYNLSNLKVGDTVEMVVEDNKPRNVEVTIDNEKQERQVLTCKENGRKISLWLSSKTLKQGFYTIAENNSGNLAGLTVLISCEEYKHPKYGITRGYRVQQKTE